MKIKQKYLESIVTGTYVNLCAFCRVRWITIMCGSSVLLKTVSFHTYLILPAKSITYLAWTLFSESHLYNVQFTAPGL